MTLFWRSLPVALTIKIAVFCFFDLYRGMWRYTGVTDLINVIKAVAVGSLLFIAAISFLERLAGHSRSVFLIDGCFTVLLIGGFRLLIRVYFEVVADGDFEAALRRLLPAIWRRGESFRGGHPHPSNMRPRQTHPLR